MAVSSSASALGTDLAGVVDMALAADLATVMDVAVLATGAVATAMDVVAMPTADGRVMVAQDAPDTVAHGLDIAVELAADTLAGRLAADSAAVAMQAVAAAMAAADTGNSQPVENQGDGLRLVPFCVYLASGAG
jgi:hypothetical protein